MQIIPKHKKYFITRSELEEAASKLYGVETISLMGGEPTMHPNFKEWTPEIKELFGCKKLTVETNGTMFKKFPEVFAYFDKVIVTRYHKDMFEGCADNLHLIEYLKDFYPDSGFIHVNNIEHTPREKRGTKPCYRAWSGGIAYEGGRLYPCCAGPGLDTKVSVPLTANWREDIKTVLPPCHDCFFAVED